jgi:hypothetical protein
LAETDLTSLVESAKTAERRGARIRDIDLEWKCFALTP